MAADSVPLTTPDRLSPESVAGTTFTSSFRGFDQDEVRAFLNRLAELVRAAESREADLRAQLEAAEERAVTPLDEDQLVSALGEETAKILVTARQAAVDIRAKAEEGAAALVRDAQEEADRLRREADTVLHDRTSEAETAATAIRQAADEEATRKLTDAERRLADVVAEVEQIRLDASDDAARIRAEADTEAAEIRDEAREAGRIEVEEARRLGRESVAEAQVVRERVLTDLARKRKAARVHLEQLRAGRDRLLGAYEVVRRTLAEATGELEGVLVDAKQAAGSAARWVEEHEAEDAETLEAELAAGRLAGLPLVSDVDVGDAGPEAEVAVAAAVEVEPDEAREADAAEPADRAADPEPPEPIHLPPRRDRRGLFRHRRSSVADELPEGALVPLAPSDPIEEVRVVKEPGPAEPADDDDTTHELDVHELFERLKAEADTEPEVEPESAPEVEAEPELEAEVEAEAETAAVVDPDVDDVELTEVTEEATPDDALLGRRDEIVDGIDRRLARKLKRALADEQNEVLDTLRRQGGTTLDVAALLPPGDEHAARYTEPATADLSEAAAAGRTFLGGNGSSPPPVDDLAAELAASITERITERLAAVVHDADGDDEAVVDGVRACYREWKSRHLDEATRHIVVAAFARGVYEALPSDGTVRWLGDDGGPPCPDCEDNALAGALGKGDAFPTGHPHPPAHPGCRCLVVPADT